MRLALEIITGVALMLVTFASLFVLALTVLTGWGL